MSNEITLGRLRETPQKIRVGDIIENHYASETNPGRRGIVVGEASTCTLVSNHNGRIHVSRYYLRDLRFDEAFQIVGHCDIGTEIANLIEKNTKRL